MPGHLPASLPKQSALTEGEPGRKLGPWSFEPKQENCTPLGPSPKASGLELQR